MDRCRFSKNEAADPIRVASIQALVEDKKKPALRELLSEAQKMEVTSGIALKL